MRVTVVPLRTRPVFDLKRLRQGIEDGLEQTAARAYAELQRPAATWSRPVAFQITRRPFIRQIATRDQRYLWTTGGTKPHIITARNGGRLAFGPSSPKTRPGSLDSGSGSRGGVQFFPRSVRHPGTKARRFEKAVVANARVYFPALVQRGVREAL
jgi:hypothetical protein